MTNTTLPFDNIASFYEIFPYVSYDEDTNLFLNKDSTGFVLKGSPLAGGSYEVQDQLAEFFRQKEHLPEGCSIQVLLIASSRIGEALEWWKNHRVTDYETFGRRRSTYLTNLNCSDANGVPTHGVPIRDYNLLFSFSFPGIITSKREKQKLETLRKSFQKTLERIGLPTQSVDALGLIKEIRNILHVNQLDTQQKASWNVYEEIGKQITSPDFSLKVEEEGVYITQEKNTNIFKTYLPKNKPDFWSLPSMEEFIGDGTLIDSNIPCTFMLHYGLHVLPNQTKAVSGQISKRSLLENSLKNALAKWMPGLEEQYNESKEVVAELQKGERVVETSFSCTLMGTQKEMSDCESKLKHIWNRNEWEAAPATYDHLNMLISSLPMMWTLGKKSLNSAAYGWASNLSSMNLAQKTITRESQNMLPIVGEWKGLNAPGIPLYGRRGQLFFWNPFGEGLMPKSKAQTDHNFNVCIAGQSGSGKSVFAQEMMMNVLSVGGQVFVLDYGRSFKKACQLMKGQHIEFDVRDPLSMNPFTNIPTGNSFEDMATREEMLACLKPTLQAMAAPQTGTNDLQNALHEKALRQAWELKKSEATIDDIKDFLLNNENPVAKDLGESLYVFSSEGSYGKFFNKPAEAQLTEDFVVIETDQLRSHPDLMTVLVQMVIIHIHQTMSRGTRDRPIMIMIDEAWKLLAGKSTGAFIAEMNRIARKYKVAIVLATQHMNDYFKPESPAATEAFNASAWKIMLFQEADVIESFHDHPQLKSFVKSKPQEKRLLSLRSNPPHFSEACIYGPGVNGAIGRLTLDPFSRLLYSTNAEEYRVLENYTKEGLTIQQAIETYLDEAV